MSSINRFAAAVLGVLAIVLVVSQWRAIHTENVNWDEFALLSRAQESIRTGDLVGGGRPGLVVLMLIPLVNACTSSIEAVVSARQMWLGFTAAYLAGVFFLVLQAARGQRCAWQGAAAAVCLLTLVPAFLRWSLQVRTDQPALMFATWGGVCLLASCRRLPLALPAGALFALGYLCTPKAAYVGALVFVLLAWRLARDFDPRTTGWRRGLSVTAVAGAGFLAAAAVYYGLVSLFYEPQPVQTVQSALNIFAFYRQVFGYRAYEAMLPSLIAHLLLVTLALCVLVISFRRPLRNRAALIACWLVLLAGFAVGRFHGGAFPYFWMTLGLFPAVAIGVTIDAILEVFEGHTGQMLLIAAAALLVTSAAPAAALFRDDTQRIQRDALAFIDRNFDPDARGFQAEGALLCRADPSPFPTYFSDGVTRQLAGNAGRPRAEAFINEFRSRPVAFLIAHRLFQFPEIIDNFWKTHYVLYRNEVMIPGQRVAGSRGDSFELDVIVPGTYRWLPTTSGPARLALAGIEIESRGTFTLDRGIHRFTLLDDAATGVLALAVQDEPRPGGDNFYDPLVIHEIDPLSPRF